VDEDIPAADLAQDDALGAIVEEEDEVSEGDGAVMREEPAERMVLKNSVTAIT
jgi:hypothetical protein